MCKREYEWMQERGRERRRTPGESEVERVVPHLIEQVAAVPWIEGTVGASDEATFPLSPFFFSMLDVVRILRSGLGSARYEPLQQRPLPTANKGRV